MPDDVKRPTFDKSKLPSRHITLGPERAPHRAMFYAMGVTEEQLKQPIVGVATTIAHLMGEGADLHTGGALHTFSALYPGEWLDESEYIHEVERRIHSVPHYAYPNVDEFWSEMWDWMWFQEEPTIATAPYAYYCVYRIASREVKVMLSGNGGDELLAGYIPYFRAYLTSALDQRHPLAPGNPGHRRGGAGARGRHRRHPAGRPARRRYPRRP